VAGSSLWLMNDVIVCHANKARDGIVNLHSDKTSSFCTQLLYSKHTDSPRVSAIMTAQDKVKETVREEAQRVAELAQDAAQSGAYLYPIRVMNAMSMTTSRPS
jgi:hypothetical protein